MSDPKLDSLEQNPPPAGREAQQELAVQLIAAAELNFDSIAARVGVSRGTLYNWLKGEDFAARVEDRREEIRADIRRHGISIRENRVRALNDRWNRLRRVMEARADDPRMEVAPGGSTGTLVRTVKGLGTGDNFTTVEEFTVDTGLLAELRAIEQQAAKELGQWADKQEIEHTGDLTLAVDLTTLPTEHVRALRDISGTLAKPRPGRGPSGG